MNDLLIQQEELRKSLKRTSDQIANLKRNEVTKKSRPEYEVPDRILDNTKPFPRVYSAKIRMDKAKNYYELMRTIEKISEECHEDTKYIKQGYLIQALMATPFPRGSIKLCKYYNSTKGCKNNSLQHKENQQCSQFANQSIVKDVNHFCLICFQVFSVAVHHPAVDCELLKALDKNALNEKMNNLQTSEYNPSFPMSRDPLGIDSSIDSNPFGNGQMTKFEQNPNQGINTPSPLQG